MALAIKLRTKDAAGKTQTRTIVPSGLADIEVIGDNMADQIPYMAKLGNLYQPLTSETVTGYELESITSYDFEDQITVPAADSLEAGEMVVNSETTTATATLVIKFAKNGGGSGNLNIRNPVDVYATENVPTKVASFAEYVSDISFYTAATSAALKISGEDDIDI